MEGKFFFAILYKTTETQFIASLPKGNFKIIITLNRFSTIYFLISDGDA
jgi:hypothetical protein